MRGSRESVPDGEKLDRTLRMFFFFADVLKKI